MSEIIDGIVYVKPNEEFIGATLIDIYTPDFIEECKKRSNGKLNTAEEILNYIKEQHPQLNYYGFLGFSYLINIPNLYQYFLETILIS